MTVDNEERNICAEISKKYKDVRFYNVKKHERAIIISMVAMFLAIVFVTPWIIAAIELLFRLIPFWDENATQNQLNVGVLPDFLGGTVGILAGFVMEWKFFNQLKLLEKYKTLIVLLQQELGGIYCAFEEQLEDKVFWLVREYVSDDIILSAENNVIIHDIHKFPFSKKGEIYKLLLNIYGHIEKFNIIIKDLEGFNSENRLEEIHKILIDIGFIIADHINSDVCEKYKGSYKNSSDNKNIYEGRNHISEQQQLKIEAKALITEVQEEIKVFFTATGGNINEYKHKNEEHQS